MFWFLSIISSIPEGLYSSCFGISSASLSKSMASVAVLLPHKESSWGLVFLHSHACSATTSLVIRVSVDLGGQCQVACNFGGHAYNVN